MPEVGEQIVGSYLKVIEECDLVEYNIPLSEAKGKGEIDVVGVNLKKKTVFLCEVTTHVLGFQYVRNKRPDNVNRLTAKFEKDFAFGKKSFVGFKMVYMFWSPIVRLTKKSKYNPINDLEIVKGDLKKRFGIEVQMIYNEKYLERFNQLKDYATRSSEASKDLPIRLLQIQGRLEQYCRYLGKRQKPNGN